jgi:hypothetical protein
MATNLQTRTVVLGVFGLLVLCVFSSVMVYAQITPSADAYTNTADPTTNYGAATLLYVNGATEVTYIQFNLASIPPETLISHATLKLYVNAVPTAGSFNVGYVNGSWTESTITANLAPALGTTIASNVALTSASKNQYILIDVTPAVQAWVGGTIANEGIALVANGTFNANFDSKENTGTSHPAELDVEFSAITSVTTGSGSGLTGGGTSGNLNLSLLTSCAANQILQWNGSAWTCSNAGTGTITGITPGPGLSGGGTSGNVTLGIASNACATGSALSGLPFTCSPFATLAGNTFTGNQTVDGNLTVLNNSNYQPFLVQSSSTFGTWLELSNTSTGGQTWNILSAGGTNGEGAGNLGITNLKGGTIWLEGPVNVSGVLHSSGNSNPTTTAQGAYFGWNALTGGTGETDFINNEGKGPGGFAFMNTPSSGSPRTTLMFISGSGGVGIGTTNPVTGQLNVFAESAPVEAIAASGWNGVTNSGQSGTPAFVGFGGNADQNATNGLAGDGAEGYGGNAGEGYGGNGFFGQGGICTIFPCNADGDGGWFIGGNGGNATGGGGDAILAQAGSGYAGNFSGNLNVTGAIFAGTKDFKIDHPLDPANKYLLHASVESSEMMNIYTGNVTTDQQGDAVVSLPDWFEALNADFRYQLTVIGQFAQAIVAREIQNHEFTIRTNMPNVKVSWQVTGVRQDAFAKSHPLIVEEEKSAQLKGFYIHPELYGAPAEKQIEWARHPEMLSKRKQQPELLSHPEAQPVATVAHEPTGQRSALNRR